MIDEKKLLEDIKKHENVRWEWDGADIDYTKASILDIQDIPVLDLESIEETINNQPKVGEWIPFTVDDEGMLNCATPDDEEEILISDGERTWKDTFMYDLYDDAYYLDKWGGDLLGLAWKPIYDEDMVAELEAAKESIRKLLIGEYGDTCCFCVYDNDSDAMCRKASGSGAWCCKNAKWNGKAVE